MHRSILAATMAIAAVVAATGPSAAAGIVCREGYQLVQGNEIATPYCEHNYLAHVARGYGVRVTNAEVRNNPNRKSEICRMIGHDIRVSSTCAGDNPSRSRGF